LTRSALPGTTTGDNEEVSTVELLVARCAGLDVAKDEVVACVRVPDGRGGRQQEVRTFQTFTSGLEALAAWLAAEGVT
jgi:transposase